MCRRKPPEEHVLLGTTGGAPCRIGGSTMFAPSVLETTRELRVGSTEGSQAKVTPQRSCGLATVENTMDSGVRGQPELDHSVQSMNYCQ